MSSEETLWTKLEQDEFLSVFLTGKYDVKLHEQISHGLAVSEQLSKLTEGISLLDKELQRQVTDHYEDLLSQATWIEKLEGVLTVMQTHIQCLLSAVERLRGKIVEPYNKIQTQTLMLTRLHATCDLLRRIIRISHLSRRLQAHMQSGSMELTKAAQTLNELEEMAKDVDLTGLEVIEEDQKQARQYRTEVEKLAKQLLLQGLNSQDQNQVENALQVFHNLGALHNTVEECLSGAKQRITSSVREELDIHNLTQPTTMQPRAKGGPGRASMVAPGNSAAFRAAFWSAIERVLERVLVECKQIELLRRQLLASPLTAHCLPPALLVLCANCWSETTALLGNELQTASHGSTFIQQALEGEYPKFLRLYLEMCGRMQNFAAQLPPVLVSSEAAGAASVVPTFTVNRQVVQGFENAYLSRSMSRLFDPVNLMFTEGGALPSHEEIDSLMRTVTSELSVSLVDAQLSRTVANNVGNTVKLFCAKCEQQVVTGGEATQVIESPSVGQTLNASIVSLLQHLDRQLRRRLANMASLPPEAAALVLAALNSASTLACNIMKPLLLSVADAVEAILLTMHGEDFSQDGLDNNKPDSPCSLYMKELQGFLARVATTYLSQFNWTEVSTECVKPIAERCLELFVRLACLVRPLGEQGRMKLAADFAQMEVAVASLCRPSELGRWYRILRSVRPLIFQTPSDIAACPALGEALPHSLALTILFSRAPTELLSPHQSAGWSVSRYCQWLDEHTSERERLELIGGALQRYQQAVSSRGETHFHPVYPAMVALLEAGTGAS